MRSQPNPQPALDQPALDQPALDQHMINEFHSYITEDFEDTLKNIPAWRNLENTTHVLEYLSKLEKQIKIALGILRTPSSITTEKANKLIVLWKCARRKDLKSYFAKLSLQSTASNPVSVYISPQSSGHDSIRFFPSEQEAIESRERKIMIDEEMRSSFTNVIR